MTTGPNQVRIIGGSWRGRKLLFPDVSGLRPTSDRIRETLFNWLMPRITGASCLDLYAGSGALGFEAASRGAARVIMVERDAAVVRALQANRDRLGAAQVELVQQDAVAFLAAAGEAFDLVFLDPPFNSGELLSDSMQLLTARGWLNADARVYAEMSAKGPAIALPEGWLAQKQKKAGQVRYGLFSYRACS